jgi:hypothetical protein
MRSVRPIFGLISVAMSAMAVVGIIIAYAVQDAAGVGILVLSAFGVPFVGLATAVVGIARRECPIIFSWVGLLANAAFPILFIALATAGVGSDWIDL